MKFSKFSLSVLAIASILIIAGCDDRDRVLGGAAVGAIAGAVIMDSANDNHRDYHYRRPPPPHYQRYHHNRYRDGYGRYRRNDHCGYDRYGNPYPCRRRY